MDLLLDVNIVIDICQPRPAFASLVLKSLVIVARIFSEDFRQLFLKTRFLGSKSGF